MMNAVQYQSETIRIVGTGDPIDPEDVMRFRLLYSGVLQGASRGDTRADHKHEIRKALSPQLERLWQTKPNLQQYAFAEGCLLHPQEGEAAGSVDELCAEGISEMFRGNQKKSTQFLPLITEDHCVRCRIDILFLRPEEGQYIIKGGDLDNRLKTLFDALRIPNTEAVQGDLDDGGKWFVLLEDDKLISEISIVADQLLLLPGEQTLRPHEVFLVIDVQIQPNHAGFSHLQ